MFSITSRIGLHMQYVAIAFNYIDFSIETAILDFKGEVGEVF